MVDSHSQDLLKVVVLLGAAVVAVPLFRRAGLGSVLGYLVAGLIIGPFGLGLFTDPQAILHVAELGVVMFLFVIGLEMRPTHLWGLRREIFGLGSLQIFACAFLLTVLGRLAGFSWLVAFVAGMGFVLTSTAIVIQLLEERGDVALPNGQKMVSILLFEDLLIVPLLAFLSFMTPASPEAVEISKFLTVGTGVASIAALIVAGVWLLNPLFRILALAKAREVMTAAALFVVLGSALLMQMGGLSMALGAFLAGVLLAESAFRHQIEADIEPFRGILLGLFFIGVGMTLDLTVVQTNWQFILIGVLAMMVTKSMGIFVVAKVMKSSTREALDRMMLMAQGGEFAFVFYAGATTAGVIDATVNANFTAIVVLSMALTPLVNVTLRKLVPKEIVSKEDVEDADGLEGSVLIIGFGRFGQVMSQLLLARNVDVTIIDSSPERIRNANRFGFKIYFGDGARLDVLRASGAANARAIAVCIDNKASATKIVELVKSEFPQAKILARAYDRVHLRELRAAGADFEIRETFESALLFGAAVLKEVGLEEDEILEIKEEIRRRDAERIALEVSTGNMEASRALMFGNVPVPAPLVTPQRESQVLSTETEKVCVDCPPDNQT